MKNCLLFVSLFLIGCPSMIESGNLNSYYRDNHCEGDDDCDWECDDWECEDQVDLCHVPPGNPAAAHTITIGVSAVDAHLENHEGDHLGECTCEDRGDCDSGLTDTTGSTGDTGVTDTTDVTDTTGETGCDTGVETDTDTDTDSDTDTDTDTDTDVTTGTTGDTGSTDETGSTGDTGEPSTDTDGVTDTVSTGETGLVETGDTGETPATSEDRVWVQNGCNQSGQGSDTIGAFFWIMMGMLIMHLIRERD